MQLYFFTVEFGLCRQNDGTFKVYGAGLLSSVAELQHAISTKEKIKRFDPEVTCKEECIITAYQNAYYYTDSFEEAKDRMRLFAESIQRPFGVKYNPYTQTVEVLSSAKRIRAAVSELRGDLSIVSQALRKVSALDHDLDVDKITQMLQSQLQVTNLFPYFMCDAAIIPRFFFVQVGDRSPVSPDSDSSQETEPKANNEIVEVNI